jgi:hypothetical protein
MKGVVTARKIGESSETEFASTAVARTGADDDA